MKTITAERIRAVLSFEELIAALDALHRETDTSTGDGLLAEPDCAGESSHLLVRYAWQPPHALGVKLATVFPRNVRRDAGLPSIQAVYVLFSGDDGRPLALIDGTELTYWKTAADSALGARYLAPAAPRVLLMVGAGAVAPHLVRAHRCVRPSLDTVLVWNRGAARAAALVRLLIAEGVDARLCEHLEQGVSEAAVISCATMSEAPLIRGEWLRPGAHLDLVGAYTPEMRESDDECLRRARVFVNCRETTLEHVGDLVQPLRDGVIDKSAIEAELIELCRASYRVRRTARDITLYKNGGGGYLDLMTARTIYRLDSGA